MLIQKSKGSRAFDEQKKKKKRLSQSNIDYNRIFPTLTMGYPQYYITVVSSFLFLRMIFLDQDQDSTFCNKTRRGSGCWSSGFESESDLDL